MTFRNKEQIFYDEEKPQSIWHQRVRGGKHCI